MACSCLDATTQPNTSELGQNVLYKKKEEYIASWWIDNFPLSIIQVKCLISDTKKYIHEQLNTGDGKGNVHIDDTKQVPSITINEYRKEKILCCHIGSEYRLLIYQV